MLAVDSFSGVCTNLTYDDLCKDFRSISLRLITFSVYSYLSLEVVDFF